MENGGARPAVMNVWAYVAVGLITAAGAAFRLYGIRDMGIAGMFPTEARLVIGAATMLDRKILIFSYFSSYPCPLPLFFTALFGWLFGGHLWAFKLAPAVLGIMAVPVVYFAGREMFSHRAGLVAAAFFASFEGVVEYSRVIYEHSFTPLFTALALLCVARFHNTKKPAWLYWFCFVCGLGFSTYVIFLYAAVAIVMGVMLTGYASRFRARIGVYIVSAICFAAGAAPAIITVFLSPVRNIAKVNAVNPLHARELLDPAYYIGALKLKTAVFSQWFTPVTVIVLLLWIAVAIFRRKTDSRGVFLSVVCAAFILGSVITPSGIDDYHYMVIAPAAALLAGSMVALVEMSAPAAASFAPALIAATVIVVGCSHHFDLSRTVYMPLSGKKPPVAELAGTGPVLSELTPDRTAFDSRDMVMMKLLAEYLVTGMSPDISGKIVSTACNRFRACPGGRQYKTISIEASMYSLDGRHTEEADLDAFYRNPDAFEEDSKQSLKDELMRLVYDEGRDTFVFFEPYPKGHAEVFRKRAVEAVEELAAGGEFVIEKQELALRWRKIFIYRIRVKDEFENPSPVR